MKTLSIDEVARLLNATPETIRRKAKNGVLPGVKIGRHWVFIEQDLEKYLRLCYSPTINDSGRALKCPYTIETASGGLTSHTVKMDINSDYAKALGLATK